MRGGRPLSRGHIHHLLTNPLYIGRVPHNGDSYEGQHPAIIDPETWDAVQKRLATRGPGPRRPARASKPSPLRGKLFDEAGAPLTPSHSVKAGRRYRYYVSRALIQGTAATKSGQPRGWRLPATEIERLVGDAVGVLFANPAELARLARDAGIHEAQIPDLLEQQHWHEKPLALVDRVELRAEEIVIHIDFSNLLDSASVVIQHRVPACMRRRGVERRLVLLGGDATSRPRVDPTLVKAVVLGRRWFEDLAGGRAGSVAEIARRERVSARHVSQLLRLAFLAPDIVARILAGTQPVDLTTEQLVKGIDLPPAWAEQRTVLGLD